VLIRQARGDPLGAGVDGSGFVPCVTTPEPTMTPEALTTTTATGRSLEQVPVNVWSQLRLRMEFGLRATDAD
jgi:hypothetical protein